MLKARDILSQISSFDHPDSIVKISGEADILTVLSVIIDASPRVLAVCEEEEVIGYVTESSLLEGLGNVIGGRCDSSLVSLLVSPADYSASKIARAVEDADVHLVDFFTVPSEGDKIRVTLRVRTSDPTSVVANLERYDYDVVEVSARNSRYEENVLERLLSLKAILNV